jgi:putative addiction module component (TIGR02574 family)
MPHGWHVEYNIKRIEASSIHSMRTQMDVSIDQVLQPALTLPDAQRAELVDALVGTLQPEDGLPFDDHWLGEIARRSAEYDQGLVKAIPWEEVKARTRKQISPDG